MAISAVFTAKFDQLEAAVSKATVSIKTFETGAKNAARDVSNLASAFSGAKMIADVTKTARAIESVGGVSKLTDSELRRVSASTNEAIEKFAKLGQDAPEAVRKLHTEVQEAVAQSEKLAQAAKKQGDAVSSSTSAVKDAGTAQGSLTSSILGTAAGYATGTAAIGAAKAGFQMLTEFVAGSIESFAASEAATKRLTTAMIAQGNAAPELVDQYTALGSKFQGTTKYADDLIVGMEALLVQVGDVGPDKMEAALAAATDLASGLGIDLEQATTLVAKAFAGNTSSLSKYGIVIDEAKLKTQGTTAVLDAIQERFGGQAAAELDTYNGKVAQLANQWDGVKEAVGGAIVESPLLNAALRTITASIGSAADSAGNAKVRLSDLIPPLGAGSGQFIAYLEDLAEGTEAVAKAQARLNQVPVPDLFKGKGGFGDAKSGWSPDARSDIDAAAKAVEGLAKSHKAAAEAADAHTKAVKAQADAYRGVDAQKPLQLAAEAFRTLSTEEKSNQAVIDRIVKSYGELRQHVAVNALPADMERFYQAHLPVIEGTKQLIDVTGRYVTAVLPDLSRRTSEVSNMLAGLTANGLIPATKAFADLYNKMQVPSPTGKTVIPTTTRSNAAGVNTLLDYASEYGGGGAISQFADTYRYAQQTQKQLGRFGVASQMTTGSAANRVAAGATAGIGIVEGAQDVWAATDKAGAGERALGGALAGAKAGAMFGPWGMAIGAAAGLVVGLVRGKPEWAKASEEVGRDFGVKISDGLAKAIAKDSKELFNKDRSTANLYHLGDIVKEAGGLNELNVDKFTGKLRDVFVVLSQGKFTTEQATKVIEENFGAFAEHVLNSKDLASKSFQDLIALNKQFGTESEQIRQFVEGQTGVLGDSIAALAGPLQEQYGGLADSISAAEKEVSRLAASGKQGTDEYAQAVANVTALHVVQTESAAAAAGEVERLGVIALGAFNAAIAGGTDYITAVDKIGPALDNLIGLQKDLGITTQNTALQELQGFRDRVNGNKSLVTATKALGETMRALASIGGLNNDTLRAMEEQGQQTFERLIAAGFTERESLMQMKDYLLNVMDAHEQLGTPIDENTKKLIEQATEMGVLGKDTKTQQQVMTEGFDKVTGAVGLLAKALGTDVPSAIQESIDRLNKIPRSVDVAVNVEYNDPGYTPPDVGANSFADGTDGAQNFGRGQLAMLHGWERVIPEEDYQSVLVGVAAAAASSGRGAVGQPTVMIDARGALLGDYASQQRLAKLVDDALTNRSDLRTQVGTAGRR